MINADFQNTLSLIDASHLGDENHDISNAIDDDVVEDGDDSHSSSFPAKHLTASNLRQLHNDLTECHENLKQELINSFEQNYPQFLELNQSLTAGTEHNLKKCRDSLHGLHKKFNAVYQQILRLLERIHSKSKMKANVVSKTNTLRQIAFVPQMMDDIKSALKTLHRDFDPFTIGGRAHRKSSQNEADNLDLHELNKLNPIKSALELFQGEFRREISSATERKQYRLLQKSCRLERVAILLTKLTAIFHQNELNQHAVVKDQHRGFIAVRNRFHNELKAVYLDSIRCGSILSLRSNLRCFNYLRSALRRKHGDRGDVLDDEHCPESIVREHFISPSITACLPISLFLNRSSLSTQQTVQERRAAINMGFDKLYGVLVEKWSVLFDEEVMVHNDFIADAVWAQLVDTMLNEDYGESFVSRGLPDLFHQHFTAMMAFLRRLQALYYRGMKCPAHCDHDQYLYYHPSSVQFRRKCDLGQYFLFRMPSITKNVMTVLTGNDGNGSSIGHQFRIYESYYRKMKNKEAPSNTEDIDAQHIGDYMKRINEVQHALARSTQSTQSNRDSLQIHHFEYNYLLPVFQVVVLNALKCWDSDRIWIWELTANFLRLTVEIMSALHKFLSTQIEAESTPSPSPSVLIVIHSDLFHFCNWSAIEFVPMITQRATECVAVVETKEAMTQLIAQSVTPCIDKLESVRDDILHRRLIDGILAECTSGLRAVDELADSWSANISFDDNEEDGGVLQQRVSEYVTALFKPLQAFLMMVSEHSLEHITVQQKSEVIWKILDGICGAYWNKIKSVQDKLAQIRKIMARRRRFKNKAGGGGNDKKSGAEKAEYQLFLDVRQFMQQIQGFIHGLQRDQRVLREKERQREEEMEKQRRKKRSSAIIVIKKKKQKSGDRDNDSLEYSTQNLTAWTKFDQFVQQFQ